MTVDAADRRVVDYFVHCGLPPATDQLHELDAPLEDFTVKVSHNFAPITDLAVIFPDEEPVPSGFKCIEKTPTGLSADLNHGSIRSREVFLCYKRGWDRPPLIDIGVLYDGKEYVMADSQVVEFTPAGRVANVNNSNSSRTYITYRRAELSAPCNQLVVTDICVIVLTKDEVPPHTYCIIPKTLNKGLVGSDVYICYKKSMRQPTRIVYKPDLLSRYPVADRPYFPLPRSVPLFCLPMGATIELWPAQAANPAPVFSTFVFTVADGAEKVYGSSITFYERYRCEDLSAEQRVRLGIDNHHPSEISINTNRSICLLSHWPFFDTFARFLLFLHELSVSGRTCSVPLERFISHFVLEVPFPSVARPRVHVQLDATHVINVCQPMAAAVVAVGGAGLAGSAQHSSGADYCQLLRQLGPDNCMLLLLYTLGEHKLLLHSLRPDTLTRVAEAVHSMIFPFQWQCPYIPLCPLGLADVLSAPVPFLVGLDSRYFDVYDPPPDVTCVDLDTNTIFVAKEKRHLSLKMLPKKPAKQLRNTLATVYHQLYPGSSGGQRRSGGTDGVSANQRVHHLELEIQEAMLRFMMALLRDYRSYLKPIKTRPQNGTTDPGSLFNMEGFLKSRDRSHHGFYQSMMRTQMFIRFIEERSFVSEKNNHLVFFDECLEKELVSPELRLLEVENCHSETTVFIPPPEPLEDRNFTYREFGLLDPSLFLPPSRLEPHLPESNCIVDGGDAAVAASGGGGGGAGGEGGSNYTARDSSVTVLPVAAAAATSGGGGCSTPTPATTSGATGGAALYASPLLRRTKHEVLSARRLALKQIESPSRWSQHLISTCFSLWFVHLPCYLQVNGNVKQVMDEAFQLLVAAQKMLNGCVDEVCYRVMMQLCGQLSLPVMAVRVMYRMKQLGVHPNALTYGYYNRAVLESQWPTDCSTPGKVLWMRLRNVVLASSEFRAAQRRRRPVTASGDPVPSSLSIADCESSSTLSLSSLRSLVPAAKRDKNSRGSKTCQLDWSGWSGRHGSIVRAGGTSGSAGSSNGHHIPLDTLYVDCVAGDLIMPTVSGVASARVDKCAAATSATNCLSQGEQKSTDDASVTLTTDAGVSSSLPNTALAASQQQQQPAQQSTQQQQQQQSTQQQQQNRPPSPPPLSSTHPPPAPSDQLQSQSPTTTAAATASASSSSSSSSSSSNTATAATAAVTTTTTTAAADGHVTELPDQRDGVAKSGSGSTCRVVRSPVVVSDPLGVCNVTSSITTSSAASAGRAIGTNTGSRCDGGEAGEPAAAAAGGGAAVCGGSATLPAGSACLKARRSLFESQLFLCFPREPFGGSYRCSEQKTAVKHENKSKHFMSHAFSMDGGRFSFSLDRASSLAGEQWRSAERHFRRHLNTVQPELDDLMKSCSPGSLKQHELVRSSVDTFKSAASSVCRKWDQWKGAVVTASPGVIKTRSLTSVNDDDGGVSMTTAASDLLQCGTDSSCLIECDSVFSSTSVLNSLLPSLLTGPAAGCRLTPEPLPEPLRQPPADDTSGGSRHSLCLTLSSSCRCPLCAAIVYDEHIMAGWSAEDSNLNSRCPYCRRWFVPALTVIIAESPRSCSASCSHHSLSGHHHRDCLERVSGPAVAASECVTVPYLSPLVLRKEVDNVLDQAGGVCLTRVQFVAQHPIIYWNMVWYMQRVCGPSHLASLYWRLHHQVECDTADAFATINARVHVHCLWYNPRLIPPSCLRAFGQRRCCSGAASGCSSTVAASGCSSSGAASGDSLLLQALALDTFQSKRWFGRLLTAVRLGQIPRALQQLLVSRHCCHHTPPPPPPPLLLPPPQSLSSVSSPSSSMSSLQSGVAGVAGRRQSGWWRGSSLYWQLLLCSLAHFGSDHFSLVHFDRHFARAVDTLTGAEGGRLTPLDRAPRLSELCCRHTFAPLHV